MRFSDPSMIRTIVIFVLLLLGSAEGQAGSSSTIHYQIDSATSAIQFVSKAPMDNVVGKTKNVTGFVELNPANMRQVTARISVDLNSIKTGNRLRDKDMREKFLQTDRYPSVDFSIGQIVSGPTALKNGATGDFVAMGEFSLHGVKRTEKIVLKVGLSGDGTTLQVESTFPLQLADYQIERPQLFILRLSETVEVTIRLSLRTK